MTTRIPRAWRRLAIPMLVGALIGTASCVPMRTGGAAPLSQLIVRNDGVFDVNVSIVASPGGQANRLGTVVGNTSATFPIRKPDLQYGEYLVVRLHAIGSRETWTSEPIAVDAQVVAVLNVHTDPFGDCSQSTMRVVGIGEKAELVSQLQPHR